MESFLTGCAQGVARSRRPGVRRGSQLLGILVLSALTGACGGESVEPGGPQQVDAPTGSPGALETPIGPVQSRLKEAVADAEALDALRESMGALRAWIDDHPTAPDRGDAVTTLGLAEVVFAGGQSALTGRPPRTEAQGKSPSDVFLEVARQLDKVEGEDALRVKEAALVLRALEPDVKDMVLDLDSALKLATERGPLGLAIQAAMLARIETALQALEDQPLELAIPAMVETAGRLLCPSCGDVHHLSPETVTHLLLGQGRGDGLVCAAAMTAAMMRYGVGFSGEPAARPAVANA